MKITKYIFLLSLFAAIASCSKNEQKLFSDVARIQFGPIPKNVNYEPKALEDTMKSHTFYYTPDVEQDTIHFDIYTIGNVANRDRAYQIEQVILAGVENAIPGVHYKAFDSEEMANHYMIPKDSVHMLVPIVMLKDRSLDDRIVTLQFRLVANEEFQLGEIKKLWRKLTFTSMLNRPSKWNSVNGYFKDYSRVKHEFMIEKSGLKWDDKLIEEVIMDTATPNYWKEFFIDELIKENRRREESLLGPLEDENNQIVTFN